MVSIALPENHLLGGADSTACCPCKTMVFVGDAHLRVPIIAGFSDSIPLIPH